MTVIYLHEAQVNGPIDRYIVLLSMCMGHCYVCVYGLCIYCLCTDTVSMPPPVLTSLSTMTTQETNPRVMLCG